MSHRDSSVHIPGDESSSLGDDFNIASLVSGIGGPNTSTMPIAFPRQLNNTTQLPRRGDSYHSISYVDPSPEPLSSSLPGPVRSQLVSNMVHSYVEPHLLPQSYTPNELLHSSIFPHDVPPPLIFEPLPIVPVASTSESLHSSPASVHIIVRRLPGTVTLIPLHHLSSSSSPYSPYSSYSTPYSHAQTSALPAAAALATSPALGIVLASLLLPTPSSSPTSDVGTQSGVEGDVNTGTGTSLPVCCMTLLRGELSLALSSEHMQALLPVLAPKACSKPFVPIEVTEGSAALDQYGLISSLALPLQLAGIEVLYISSYHTDLVLVPEEHAVLALELLRRAAVAMGRGAPTAHVWAEYTRDQARGEVSQGIVRVAERVAGSVAGRVVEEGEEEGAETGAFEGERVVTVAASGVRIASLPLELLPYLVAPLLGLLNGHSSGSLSSSGFSSDHDEDYYIEDTKVRARVGDWADGCGDGLEEEDEWVRIVLRAFHHEGIGTTSETHNEAMFNQCKNAQATLWSQLIALGIQPHLPPPPPSRKNIAGEDAMFSFFRSSSEITLVGTPHMIASFLLPLVPLLSTIDLKDNGSNTQRPVLPLESIFVHPVPWLPMDIMEGAGTFSNNTNVMNGNTSSLVRPVSALLAKNRVPIMYHSTHGSDLVLVQGNRAAVAIEAMRNSKRFVIEE